MRRASLTGIAIAALAAQPALARDVAYGEAEAMRGIYASGFEQSAMRPCDPAPSRCSPAEASEQACWVDFTREAALRYRELAGDGAWGKRSATRQLAFTGRKSTGAGRFGHMGAFDCQIRIEDVSAVTLLSGAD
jgi:hypothetical protein